MADFEALAAWKAELATRRERALDPILDADARRASDRAAIIGNGDTWTKQAVAYELAMAAAPPKPDPAAQTKHWPAARHGGLSRGTR